MIDHPKVPQTPIDFEADLGDSRPSSMANTPTEYRALVNPLTELR
jgi:hypothetical protein